MKRRSFLIGAGSAITSGCISTANDTRPREAMHSSGTYFTVNSTDVRPERGITMTAEVVQQPDQQTPPKLSIAVRNSSDSPRSYVSGPNPPFDPSIGHQSGGAAQLFMVPADGTGFEVPEEGVDGIETRSRSPEERLIPGEPAGGCWAAQDATLQTYTMARGNSLDPGESTARTYVLLAHPGNERCLPDGQYEFRDTARVGGEDITQEITLRTQSEE